MRLRDPRAPRDTPGVPDSHVHVKGDLVEVEGDGTFEHPGIDEQWAQGYAERNDSTLGEVLVGESTEGDSGDSDADESNGDICGYEKDDGSRCKRTSGWGRDSDVGRCKDHYND